MAIERLFVSCRTVRWRQLSNIPFIRWTTIFVTLIIALEGLPFLILTKIVRSNGSSTCTPMYNSIFAKYASFFCIPVLFGILPLGIMIAMSILIYYKLHNRTHLRKAQRSLTLIILLRIVFILISCGPYTLYFIYSAIVSVIVITKSAERIATENFILNIVSVFLYITYSSSFYIYYYISLTYRKKLTDIFRYYRRRNVVQPRQVVATTLPRRNVQNVINNIEEDKQH
jgi:hypothetical protein